MIALKPRPIAKATPGEGGQAGRVAALVPWWCYGGDRHSIAMSYGIAPLWYCWITAVLPLFYRCSTVVLLVF
jgi:hypothetical protein